VLTATSSVTSALGEGSIQLTAGQPASIRVDYQPFSVPAYQVLFSHLVLGAQTPDDPDPIAAAAQAAKTADTAIVFASDLTTEGADRTSLALPGDENALIEAVADANPHTVVVLNTSSAVSMPWLDKVGAVLETWYPGEQYGSALSSLLFGDANPSAKLPVTFPASDEQGPWGAGALQYPGDGTNVFYSEGIDVGYRWYDAQHATPLFPFGYGLSYTSFAFSNMAVTPRADGSADVSFDLTNTGGRAGADIAQVYVGPGPTIPGVQQAVRSLRGFDRVALDPGQTKQETITLDPRSFQYWNSAGQTWTTDYGQRTIWVGDSSTNLPLTATTAPLASASQTAGVGGTVPATLSLTLGAPATFGTFTPGVDKTYTTSTTADVLSTAGDATLSVSDPGHLANGTFSLREPLQVTLSKSSWTAPVSHDPVTIGFSQHIGTRDALRTGTYSRSLTFTLATTTP
jgi:beta-glucosidase